MAENSVILSVEEEAKLLQPIDEYVGKIQDQIDALRVDGTDQVNNISNCIAIAKENKNLSKEEQAKLIAEYKQELEKAKSVENANKQEVTRLIAKQKVILPSITIASITILSQRAVKQKRKQKTVIMIS